MLIGLNGKLKSGKDTTYGIIKELRPDAKRIAFADKLKQLSASALGTDLETLEFFKNHEEIRFSALSSKNNNKYYINSFNLREFVQRIGTEGGRETFGVNFWVDQTLPSNFKHEGDLIIVTDMRFPNEIDRVIELGGFTVRLNRQVNTAHGNHPTEQDIDDSLIDWELDNTADLEQLKINIEEMLNTFEGSYAYSN